MAWLHAVPEKQELSRSEKFRRGDTEPPSSPPLGAFGFLINWLFDVGPILNGGMGQAPLTYQEIKSWDELMGFSLTGWEASILKRLSNSYLSELQQAKTPNRPSPYQDEEQIMENRAKVSNKIDSIFESIVDKQRGK